jgi:hypothetical protein
VNNLFKNLTQLIYLVEIALLEDGISAGKVMRLV